MHRDVLSLLRRRVTSAGELAPAIARGLVDGFRTWHYAANVFTNAGLVDEDTRSMVGAAGLRTRAPIRGRHVDDARESK